MEENTTLEIIAPTVEEALTQGLAQLGLPADAVSMEVLDAGKSGFLGLGGRQVRIRLTVKTEKETAEMLTVKKSRTEVRQKAPVPSEPVEENPAATVTTPKKPDTANNGIDPLLNLVEETVSSLLALMKVEAQVSAEFDGTKREKETVRVDVHGKDLGVLVGRKAETLNAIQYITSLILSKQMEKWIRVIVDVEGYRTRRENQLQRMAHRMAEQAIRTGRQQSLEPMPANERRIIHLTLRNNDQVETISAGDDPRRKVTIIPKNRK